MSLDAARALDVATAAAEWTLAAIEAAKPEADE